jgi:hypothetical protein
VHGIGRRKSSLQKSIEYLEESLDKLKGYNHKLYECGERNSYSKTDHDATFMRMKEDAMRNGQLKPAYNLQYGVDAEYVTWAAIGPQPTDTTTLIPFLKAMEGHLPFQYEKIIADAGYESEENYFAIEGNGQIAYIKPQNYEKAKTRKYKKDIGRFENMDYDTAKDCYHCIHGRTLHVSGTKKSRTKTGYEVISTIYTCEDCSHCPDKAACIKGHNSKTPLEERTKKLWISKPFQQKRKEDEARIKSEEGILLRINRSIQSEGAFGNLKADLGFRRYLCRGSKNVLAESILLAMGCNINKLHHKIQNDRIGHHLFEIKKNA